MQQSTIAMKAEWPHIYQQSAVPIHNLLHSKHLWHSVTGSGLLLIPAITQVSINSASAPERVQVREVRQVEAEAIGAAMWAHIHTGGGTLL
jgi:hypothetical protein